MPAAACCPQLPAPPVYAKVNPADAPVITLAISSTSLPITTVEDLADTRIAQKISQLSGVGLVSISGGQRPAVRVQANLQQLAAYGLNIDDLRTTISNNNSNAPKGSFDGAVAVLHHQRQRPAAERRRLRQHRGRLQERRAGASVATSPRWCRARRTTKLSSWANKTPAVLLNVQRQPGANVIAVVDSDQGDPAPDPGRPAGLGRL